MKTTLRRDLFAHNDWGRDRVLALCDGLDDAALDEPVTMGFGSLRATVHHLWAAERLWLDRWKGLPWGPLETDAQALPISDLAARWRAVGVERNEFLDQLGPSGEDRIIAYQNTRREAFENRLGDLMMHVSNHGIHHRAQALNMLKRHGRKTFGLDYLFFRIERPTVALPSETVTAFRARQFPIDAENGVAATIDLPSIRRYYAYGDWATAILFDLAPQLPDEALDRPFDMGPGTLRRTLGHIRDAEDWWYRNWTQGPSPFTETPAGTPLAEVRAAFVDVAGRREAYLNGRDDAELDREVEVHAPGGWVMRFRLGESMLQLCGHGTHHRAQIANMLRQCGLQPPALDFVVWLRGL